MFQTDQNTGNHIFDYTLANSPFSHKIKRTQSHADSNLSFHQAPPPISLVNVVSFCSLDSYFQFYKAPSPRLPDFWISVSNDSLLSVLQNHLKRTTDIPTSNTLTAFREV